MTVLLKREHQLEEFPNQVVGEDDVAPLLITVVKCLKMVLLTLKTWIMFNKVVQQIYLLFGGGFYEVNKFIVILDAKDIEIHSDIFLKLLLRWTSIGIILLDEPI